MTTLRNIAKITGVSKSTVSRVLNNEKYVSDEIRRKVLKVIEETNYTPNGNAINLSRGKNYVLGVAFPHNNSCYDQLVNSILHQAKLNDYQVLLLPTYYEDKIEKDYYSLLEKKTIDGLILTSQIKKLPASKKLALRGKIVATEQVADHEFPSIYPDRDAIYKQLFSKLHQQKTSKIIFTVKRKPAQSKSTRDKIKSYETYFGKAIEGQHYFIDIAGYSEGYHWALATFAEQEVPEVIYANGDDTAAGIISGLKILGLDHKKDFQIIGEGNTPYSEVLDFSTIDFFPDKIGKTAVDFLLSGETTVAKGIKPLFVKR